MAVVASRHGCEKKSPRPWEGKDSGTFTQLYRHLNGTIPVSWHYFTYSFLLVCLYLRLSCLHLIHFNYTPPRLSKFLCSIRHTRHLISDTLCTVLYINDTTTLKAILRQYMLHDFIVPMSIYPEIGPTFETPVQAGFRYPLLFSVRCQPMNHSIRFIIEPCSFINLLIRCKFFSGPNRLNPLYLLGFR